MKSADNEIAVRSDQQLQTAYSVALTVVEEVNTIPSVSAIAHEPYRGTHRNSMTTAATREGN